jgi:hypothetical protein
LEQGILSNISSKDCVKIRSRMIESFVGIESPYDNSKIWIFTLRLIFPKQDGVVYIDFFDLFRQYIFRSKDEKRKVLNDLEQNDSDPKFSF